MTCPVPYGIDIIIPDDITDKPHAAFVRDFLSIKNNSSEPLENTENS